MTAIREFQNHESRSIDLLAQIQLIELSLKIYLAAAYGVTRQALNGSLPFKYGYKDIENWPLERLLAAFSKLNDDSALQARLNKLRDIRNAVAHRALLYRHDVIRSVLGIDLDEHVVDVDEARKEANECLIVLGAALEGILKKFNVAGSPSAA